MAEDTRKRPDYASDHSSAPASDPLAELARLIGQNDPFNDLNRRGARKPLDSVKHVDRPAPEWLARPASSPDQDYADEPHAPREPYVPPSYRADQYDEPAAPYQAPAQNYRPQGFAEQGPYAESDRYAPDQAAHDPQAYRAEHDGAAYQAADDAYQPDDRYRVALPSGQYESDSYYAEDGHLPPQGDEGLPPVRRRGGLATVAAVVGLAVIGTAGAFGYRAFTSHSGTAASPPVIKADPTPAKTVPPAPATADSQGKPFQDRIGALAAPERVVPREEQPVSLPVAPPVPRVTAPQPSAQAAAPLVSPPPPTSVNEPKRVKTIPIRQDSGGADTGAISPLPASASVASARTPSAKQSSAAPMAIAPQSGPPARTKVATRSAPPAPSAAYVVQVSAQRTEAEAQSSYQALQSKYPSVLGTHSANIRRVDLGDKGGIFYRAQVGSFATSEQATTFCNSLKDAGGQCIVQRN